MKNLGSILLGSAIGLALVGGAQGADLPTRKAAPIEYVRICSAFGAGYFYIPGTDTCLKIGGVVRGDYYLRPGAPSGVPNQFAYNLAGTVYTRDLIQYRTREYINLDARSTTEFGDLRAYASVRFTDDSLPPAPFGGGRITVAGLPPGAKENAGSFQGLANQQVFMDAAFVQWAGLTAGVAHSFFDFYTHNYEVGSYAVGVSDQPLDLIAYTAKFGGFSVTASAEDPTTRRIGDSTGDTLATNVNPSKTTAAYLTYGALNAPDVVGNMRYDGGWGSAQVAGALHEVNSMPIGIAGGTLPVGYTPSTVWGGALDAGVKFKLDSFSAGDSMTAQVSWDKGAADYTNAWNYWTGTTNVYFKNLNISVPANDAFVLPNGSIGLSQAVGGFLGYQHYWAPSLRSTLLGSYLQIREPSSALLLSASTTNATLWDIGLNTVWSPVKALDIGAEVLYTNLQLSGAKLATGSVSPTGATIATPANSNDWRGRLRIQVTF
ncbi:MAG: porin [Roseiarcus sp.]|jgi:hypothetical protein